MTMPIDLACRPCLLWLRPDEVVEVPLDGPVTVGREADCQILLEGDPEVSRRHCRVVREDDGFWLEDLRSHNGTRLNDRVVTTRAALVDGDVIRVGRSHLRFVVDAAHHAVDLVQTTILKTMAPTVEGIAPYTPDPALSAAMKRLRGLLTLAESLASVEDEHQVARIVLLQILQVVGGQQGAVWQVRDGDRILALAALRGDGTEDPHPPLSRTVIREVLSKQLGLISEDALMDRRLTTVTNQPAQSLSFHGLRSILCVPMMFRGSVMGLIQISSKSAGSFSEDDLRLVTGMALEAAVSLASARLLQERRRMIQELMNTQVELKIKMEQLRLLYQLERRLTTTHDLPRFLAAVADQAVACLRATAGSLFLIEEGTGRLCFAYPSGGAERQIRHQTFPKDRGIVGFVVRTGESVLDNDAPSNPHFDAQLSAGFGLSPKNVAAVPLIVQDGTGSKVIGALEVLNRTDGGFDGSDLELLQFLAAQVSSALLLMRLIEERTKAERLAAIGSMASTIVHDFANPMTVILGYVEQLESEQLTPEQRAKYVRIVRTQVQRCSTMAKEILHFVRGEAVLAREELQIPDLISEVAGALENEAAQGNVSLKVNLAALPPVRADADKLKRVLFNLASNSLAAMAGGGTLTLGCELGLLGIRMIVQDTGPGIAPEVRDRLFTPFATFGKKEGTGLGLSIVKRIVEGHGGTINVEDAAPSGARFVIELPI